MAVIGAGRGSDCAPKGSNYEVFFDNAKGERLLVEISGAGHFAFLPFVTAVEQSICSEGKVPAEKVVLVTESTLRLWAERTLKDRKGSSPNAPEQFLAELNESLAGIELSTLSINCSL